MSSSSKPIQMRAQVGVIFSEASTTITSKESENLAFYISCCFAFTGHASVHLIPSTKDGSLMNPLPSNRRISYVPPGQSRSVEIPASDVSFSHWSILENCHIIVVTVNGSDNKIAAQKLLEAIQTRKDIMIFSMQRGVRNGSSFKDLLTGKSGITYIECVVGFGVVQHSRSLAYISTIPNPALAIPRLSKEIMRVAEGPVNLLEATNIQIFYKKVITTHSWGVSIYEHLYALNAITGGTISDSLQSYPCRRVYATMIRESHKTLLLAAQHGIWRANMEQISWILSPRLLEMILLLPWPLFNLVSLLVSLPAVALPSPGSVDLTEGRECMTVNHVNEILTTAHQVGYNTPVCEAVYDKLKSMNASRPSDTTGRCGSKLHFQNLETTIKKTDFAKDSQTEYNYYMFRIVTVASFIFALYFLLTSD